MHSLKLIEAMVRADGVPEGRVADETLRRWTRLQRAIEELQARQHWRAVRLLQFHIDLAAVSLFLTLRLLGL
jgi:hypothetical protein